MRFDLILGGSTNRTGNSCPRFGRPSHEFRRKIAGLGRPKPVGSLEIQPAQNLITKIIIHFNSRVSTLLSHHFLFELLTSTSEPLLGLAGSFFILLVSLESVSLAVSFLMQGAGKLIRCAVHEEDFRFQISATEQQSSN